jgi:hypothetical protein
MKAASGVLVLIIPQLCLHWDILHRIPCVFFDMRVSVNKHLNFLYTVLYFKHVSTYIRVYCHVTVTVWATGWTAGVWVPVRASYFYLLHGVQTGSGENPASYPMGMGGCFSEVKRSEREADHSSPSSAEAENGGAILPLPHMRSWHGA